ncbi:MAG: hypothetical protein QM754_08095 [Tepidisphaeraceae bacterium]
MNTWVTWDSTGIAWAAVAAVVLAAVLSARHYAGANARTIAGLRGLALGLLAVTALRPTFRYTLPPDTARPVRIVVDDSLSMAVTDSARSAGRRLRLAMSLGQYDEVDVPWPTREAERLAEAANKLKEANTELATARQKDPIAALFRDRVNRAHAAVLQQIEVLRSSVRSAGGSARTLDALDRGEAAIVNDGDVGGLLGVMSEISPELRQITDAAFERAASDPLAIDAIDRWSVANRFDAATAAAARLAATLPGGATITTIEGKPLNPAVANRPTLASSSLTAALRDACARAVMDRAEAVVLLSDGRSTEPRSLLATAASSGVPVYTVNVAPEDKSPDARILRANVRSTVLAGQPMLVRVRVAQRNANGRPAKLTVTDGRHSVSRVVTLGPDNTFDFLWTETVAPKVNLVARLDALSGEVRLQNNSIAFEANVFDRRVHTLFVTGQGSRDVSECGDALNAVPWIQSKRFNATPGLQQGKFDRSAVAGADLIVMSDVAGDLLNEEDWQAIENAVKVDGKSLIVLAGQGEWLSDPAVSRHLTPLLPVTAGPQPAWLTPPQRVWPVPTRFAGDTPYLRIDESADASYRAWLGRPRPGRVLSVGPAKPDVRVLLADRTTQQPMIVDGATGLGRVTMVLFDEAWRWTTPESPDVSRRFWQDLAQTVVDLPYDSEASGLAIALDRDDVSVGTPVGLRVRTLEPNAGPVTVVARRAGAVDNVIQLREILPGSGRFVGFLQLPTGEFEIVARQGTRWVSRSLNVRTGVQQELADTTPDAGMLQRIADATGGSALSVDELDRLPTLLERRRQRAVRMGAYEIWSSPYWFALIVSCFGLEWALRPKAGLV